MMTALEPGRHSFFTGLECSTCSQRYGAQSGANLCECGSPLLARYDLAALGASGMTWQRMCDRGENLWRFHELLPVGTPDAVVSLGESATPLLGMPRLGKAAGLAELFIKDDGRLPTGTFKARGAAMGVTRAVELGYGHIAMPTNGNAGAAWAAYAARAGLRCTIAMPLGAPRVNRTECVIAGAELFLIDGSISDAGRSLAPLFEQDGEASDVLNASTLKEPYRLEGKKTIGLEIVEQCGGELPDVIVYPTGGGVGLLGMHKAFKELLTLGWVTGDLPRFVAVQAESCAPIVESFERGARQCDPWPTEATTAAFGIAVPAPLGGGLILDVLYETDGRAIALPEDKISSAQRQVARDEGLYLCPEGAAAVCAALQLADEGWIGADERVVVLNTGSGLKYVEDTAVGPTLAPGQSVPYRDDAQTTP